MTFSLNKIFNSSPRSIADAGSSTESPSSQKIRSHLLPLSLLILLVIIPILLIVTYTIADNYSLRSRDVAGTSDWAYGTNGLKYKTEAKAEGTIKFICDTPLNENFTKTLAKGTRLSTKNGLEYELTSDVTVTCPISTFTTAEVIAIDVGFIYNIDQGIELRIADKMNFHAVTQYIITGGRGIPKEAQLATLSEDTAEEESDTPENGMDGVISDNTDTTLPKKEVDQELTPEQQRLFIEQTIRKYMPERGGFSRMPGYMQDAYGFTDKTLLHLRLIDGLFGMSNSDTKNAEKYTGMINGLVKLESDIFTYKGDLNAIPDEELRKKIGMIEHGVLSLNSTLAESTDLMMKYYKSQDVEEMAKLLKQFNELNNEAWNMQLVVEELCVTLQGKLDEERGEGV